MGRGTVHCPAPLSQLYQMKKPPSHISTWPVV